MTPGSVLDFWFADEARSLWFNSTPAFDRQLRNDFESTWRHAALGHLSAWENTPQGALALVIVLDQFPRNLFRDDARAYATDGKALRLASDTIDKGWDQKIPPQRRAFLYMPFQHSEDREDQARSVALFTSLGNKDNLDFTIKHKEIIDRFGRFPHRNEVLGRTSTPEERDFLKGPALFW